MIKLFLNHFRRKSARQSSVPERQRIYAIGDVHGCLAQLEVLLANIEDDARSTSGDIHLIFVGDLIDRGPASAGVLRRLRRGDLPATRTSFILGNHEEAFLDVYDGTAPPFGWLKYGGLQTLESYGIPRAEVLQLGSSLRDRMQQAVPPEDIHFMRGFEDVVRVGSYVFVHAGVRPGVRIDDQDPTDLRWIRDEFLFDTEADHGAVVVHGHTIVAEPEVQKNRIGIDTGCYRSGRLTAAVLEGDDCRFIST